MWLSLVKMPSGPNALEISDIQEDEIVATPRRRSECNNVTLRRKSPNEILVYHTPGPLNSLWKACKDENPTFQIRSS